MVGIDAVNAVGAISLGSVRAVGATDSSYDYLEVVLRVVHGLVFPTTACPLAHTVHLWTVARAVLAPEPAQLLWQRSPAYVCK